MVNMKYEDFMCTHCGGGNIGVVFENSASKEPTAFYCNSCRRTLTSKEVTTKQNRIVKDIKRIKE